MFRGRNVKIAVENKKTKTPYTKYFDSVDCRPHPFTTRLKVQRKKFCSLFVLKFKKFFLFESLNCPFSFLGENKMTFFNKENKEKKSKKTFKRNRPVYLRQLVEKVGSQTEVAAMLGLSSGAINQYLSTDDCSQVAEVAAKAILLAEGKAENKQSELDFASAGIRPLNLENLFSYHAPKGDQVERYQEIREWGLDFAKVICKNTKLSEEQQLAIRKLQEVVMLANMAIAVNE